MKRLTRDWISNPAGSAWPAPTPAQAPACRPDGLRRVLAGALALWLGTSAPGLLSAQTVSVYEGPCDASAGAALNSEHFVVGNDETNVLHVYRRGQAAAVGALTLSKFLGTGAGEEADIEGAAAAGNRVYWISSHGANSRGKAKPNRQRFFATEVLPGQPPTLKPVGEPYRHLLRDMEASSALRPYALGDAARRAPEADGGLNIEGLAATLDGRLLIGLRNPLPRQRAVLIPLENPAEVVDQGAVARFGAAIEIDLGQRGIRAIERVGQSYLIVAGPSADQGSFALYRWSGRPGDEASLVPGVGLRGVRPETLFAVPHSGQVQLLSDDGGVRTAGVECKKLPADRQTFRSLTVTP